MSIIYNVLLKVNAIIQGVLFIVLIIYEFIIYVFIILEDKCLYIIENLFVLLIIDSYYIIVKINMSEDETREDKCVLREKRLDEKIYYFI